jgi:hypothetical protein
MAVMAFLPRTAEFNPSEKIFATKKYFILVSSVLIVQDGSWTS